MTTLTEPSITILCTDALELFASARQHLEYQMTGEAELDAGYIRGLDKLRYYERKAEKNLRKFNRRTLLDS